MSFFTRNIQNDSLAARDDHSLDFLALKHPDVLVADKVGVFLDFLIYHHESCGFPSGPDDGGIGDPVGFDDLLLSPEFFPLFHENHPPGFLVSLQFQSKQ